MSKLYSKTVLFCKGNVTVKYKLAAACGCLPVHDVAGWVLWGGRACAVTYLTSMCVYIQLACYTVRPSELASRHMVYTPDLFRLANNPTYTTPHLTDRNVQTEAWTNPHVPGCFYLFLWGEKKQRCIPRTCEYLHHFILNGHWST